MALVNMRDMLWHAYENDYAVGAFDLVSLDFLEAVMAAAEEARAGIILSVAEPHFRYYDVELLMPAVEAAARRASVPVAIQLDHGGSLESARQAIALGCNGVMLDASDRELPDNIDATREVVAMAHACGVTVMGEVGYVAGSEGVEAEFHPGDPQLTIPAEARAYVERTGVDCLAVSIGTMQGRVRSRTRLDFQRLRQLRENIDVPMEIHGGSGLNEDQYRKLTALGIAKINYFTALSDVAASVMRKQSASSRKSSFIDLKQGVKEAIGDEVRRCLRLWGSAGRAAEILTQCRAWNNVNYMIFFNASQTDTQAESLIRNAMGTLQHLPGLRDIHHSASTRRQGSVSHCCRLTFAHESCLKSLDDDEAFGRLRRALTEYSPEYVVHVLDAGLRMPGR